MKNFTLKLCLIFTILSICATSFADVVFKFKTPSDWSKCHIWAWDDDNTQLASTTDWPGDAAMTLSSDGYYTYTLKTSVTKVNFLFNNGASSGTKQTVDASTTETKFMGRYGSTDTQGHYYITEETFVDTDDSGDDDVVTPDNPQPTGEVTISAIRNRLSINTNDFTDFAGLYVSELPKAGDATVSYEWQYSTDNATWTKYSAGDGATWDNIRPNKAGYYRCVISYDLAGEITTITSNTLQITNKGGNSVSFSSKLPVILVRTAKDFPAYPGNYPNIEQVEALKAKRSVDVKILWNEEGGSVTNADINNADMLHYDRKARMNYRGSSSLYNPKRSYAFVSGDKNCDAKKLGEVKTKKFGMFGAAANKDWVLYASYPDATYMRNVLTYHQYAKMTGLWGAKCKYVELYIDGSYQGIYVFMDKITQDESRINVNEDTGYIVKFDKTDIADRYSGKEGANEDYKRNTFTTSYTGRTGISTYNITVDQAFEIEYPEREDIAEFDDDGNVTNDAPWEAKVAEIKGIFENMEKAILANDYTRLATIIDYDSWADYFIMNEFSRNADAYRISCVFTVNSASDKIVANPMWDYELGWGNQDTKTSGLMVEDDQYYEDDFPTPFWWTGKGKSGCNGILGDCKFRAKVLERWEKHVGEDGALNSDVLNAKIDSLKTALSGSSTNTSVSTSSLKSWVINRTSGLNTEFNTWDACPDLKFALVGTINDEKLSTYASGIPFTMQDDGSYTAVFTASETTHNLQIITSTGDIWARNDSKDIVSTSEDASSYATMTKGQTTGYANITTVANTEYTFTFKLNADGVSGKLTYLKGNSVLPDPFVVTPTIKNLKCYNDYDGAISIEVSGSVAPYTYTWTYPDGTEVATKDISGLRAGVYSLKIEDSVGLTYEATYEVTQPDALDVKISVKNVTCGGYPDGMIDLEMSGGTSPIDFSCYDDQKVLSDIVNLKGGDYSVVLTDANGCTFEKEFYIYEPEKLELVVNSIVEPSEFGASDGFIDITVTGGTGSYKYQWSGYDFEADTEDINNLVSNIYELTVKDENNCAVYERIELSEPAPKPFAVNSYVTNVKCNGGNDGSISLEVAGSVAPYTYTWTCPDGTEVNTKDISGLAAGVYTLIIVDNIGEIYEETYEVTEPEALNISESITHVTCNGFADGTIDIQVTGGIAPYNYSWKSEGFESFSEDLENLKAGVYTVTVLDANGCSLQKEISVTEPEKLNAELISGGTIPYCKSIGELTFDVKGGVAPYTYELHKGSIDGEIVSTEITATNLPADAYYAYVYDANGCRAYTKQIINSTEELRLIINSVIEPTEYGAKDGSIDITVTGGLEPYTYEWRGTDFNSSSEDVSGLGADIYKIIVTDANDCLVNDAIELKQPAPKPFVVTPTIKNLKCYNDYDGSISLEVSGSVAPYTYTWTYPNGTEVNTKDISGLTAGVYTLRIEDSIGEIYEETYEVTEPEKLNAELISGGTIPYCKSIGELTFDVTGGVAPYTYELHKGSIYGEIVSTSSEAFNLEADAYYAYVYDANGCRYYTKQIIESTEELKLKIESVNNPSEYGAKDGSIDITVTGGLEPYTYEWRGTDFNSSSEDVSGLGADIYKIIVTDANDCLVNDAIELKQPEKVKYNYFTVLLDGDCYGEYTFSEDNDNRILFTEEVESSNLNTYTIIANCDASIFENNIYVLLEEAGVYDVEIIFNGDYETPNFTYNVTKKSIPTEVQDIESDVIINVEKGLISVYNREFSIYNVIGQDVTVYNGSLLPGVYMVQIGDISKKVIMK